MRMLLLVLTMALTQFGHAQTFNDYIEKLGILPIPNKFSQWPDSLQDYPLPTDLFDYPIFDLENDEAFAKIEFDDAYSIILIGRSYGPRDYFSSIIGVSFDSLGNYVDRLRLSHDATGEGSTFSLTPEGKILSLARVFSPSDSCHIGLLAGIS